MQWLEKCTGLHLVIWCFAAGLWLEKLTPSTESLSSSTQEPAEHRGTLKHGKLWHCFEAFQNRVNNSQELLSLTDQREDAYITLQTGTIISAQAKNRYEL